MKDIKIPDFKAIVYKLNGLIHIQELYNYISEWKKEIDSYTPSSVSSENQLADKQYVNQGISTSSATFRGTSASGLTEEQFLAWADSLEKDNNDYCNWLTTDTSGKTIYKRYKYNGTAWAYEFDVADPSSIPTTLAELSEDTTHRVVTDTEKAAWNSIIANIKSMLAGDDFVDLGLPSGTLWAKFNIGATKPEEAGLYFSWGNVEGHAVGSGYDFSLSEYETTPGYNISSNIPESITSDASRHNLGSPFKMPTKNDFKELIDNCTSTWTSINGVNGVLLTSNINNNTLFFPAIGCYDETSLVNQGSKGFYWSSGYVSSTHSTNLTISSDSINYEDANGRRKGYAIRTII